jgi:hypothetical protein
MMAKKQSQSQKKVAAAMREVHKNEPSTVALAHVSPARKEKMRKAIALEKARKAGARIPRKKGR